MQPKTIFNNGQLRQSCKVGRNIQGERPCSTQTRHPDISQSPTEQSSTAMNSPTHTGEADTLLPPTFPHSLCCVVIRNSLPFLVSRVFLLVCFYTVQLYSRYFPDIREQCCHGQHSVQTLGCLRRKPHRQLSKSVLGAARQKCAEK